MARGEAYLLLDVEPGKERDILETVRDSDCVEDAYILFGVYDMIVKVKCRQADEIGECIKNIKHLEGVGSVKVLEVADVVV
ncbi:MAG: Lrp/AsnC ligand binding domain-containing protein [Candidatus Woesearchaeota archaeon]|nr:MAG: Lrp/AsnC ligand binding domain-containing protein [Candidatus Woesearchaeota archaeon]